MGTLPKPATRKETLLNAIATGDSSGLPAPATREEVFLAYIAENGGGGGASAFIVTFTMGNSGWEPDKTIEEIAEAYNGGNIVIGVMDASGSMGVDLLFNLTMVGYGGAGGTAQFVSTLEMDGFTTVAMLTGTSDGSTDTWTQSALPFPSLPSGTNNGDMLVWQDGAWTAQALADADTSSY